MRSLSNRLSGYDVAMQWSNSSPAVAFEKVYIGEIWVKRDGQWKSLHYQETRVK